LFGASWGALRDYGPTNRLAHALASLMYELHWRVTDLTDRAWRADPHRGPVGGLLRELDAFIEPRIDEAVRRTAREPADSCMLDAWARRLSPSSSSGAGRALGEPALTRSQVRNLCLTFLTMGHENVATALAWCVILLAEHPDELADVVAAPTADVFDERLLRAFEEATRLYPSVAGLTRMNLSDAVVGGVLVPARTEVAVNMFDIHRDTAAWGADSCGYPDAFPFGVGARRSCLGRPLSYLELRLLVGPLLRRFDLVSATPSSPCEADSYVSLRPGPHRVLFVPRTSEAARL